MIFRLVERRWWYFSFSAVLILIGLVTLAYSTITTGQPLKLGIDFSGGTIYELQFTDAVGEEDLRQVFEDAGYEDIVVQELQPLETNLIENATTYPDGSRWSVRTEEAGSSVIDSTLVSLGNLKPLDREATSTNEVSGQVGGEVTQAGVIATLATTLVISGFIYLAFRKIYNPLRYGLCAIAAMFHDLLIIITAMSLFGMILGWEADALFLTALLTVLGFSVQDTIVVFDRIRENEPRRRDESYELIVNRSVLETLHRSLATQLNAIFVMIAIALFGGDTIREFIVILLVGLLSGTYSSIFIAVPLLVSWEKGEIPFINRAGKEKYAKEVAL